MRGGGSRISLREGVPSPNAAAFRKYSYENERIGTLEIRHYKLDVKQNFHKKGPNSIKFIDNKTTVTEYKFIWYIFFVDVFMILHIESKIVGSI